MNIFKILSNGDGKIHEPNISAFLAYLLDPAEEHGLRGELLSKILNTIKHYQSSSSVLISVYPWLKEGIL